MALLAIVPATAQQQFTPHVGYAYPAGGKLGTTFDVTIGGQYLDGVKTGIVSGSSVHITIVEHAKLLTQNQANKLRDELQELTQKRNAATKRKKGDTAPAAKVDWTPENEKRAEEIRKKLAGFIRRPANASIAELVKVKVTVDKDASPGERELRLVTPAGLTNPLVFCVGQLPEFTKEAAKVSAEINAATPVRFRGQQQTAPQGPVTITLPAVVNGQIPAGGVDKYRFKATQGQKLVVAAAARELIPYISDAVPGWFQGTLALYDAKGKEVNYSDSFRFHPDPVLFYEIPGDGEYTMEIKDSIYRGREDFVYRITVGELPYVTSIFPLGAKVGTKTNVQIKGWNLPVAKLTEDAKKKASGVYPISVRKGEFTSNHVPFSVDTVPETMEREPNNLTKNAQSVKLPIIVNGRIDQANDKDIFKFDGRAGEEIVAEVFARRLDSPLDSVLTLTDSTGKQLAVNDDHEDKGTGLLTHHADSRILFKLPANGTYYVQLADTQGKGGPEYTYRLRISRPQPDFDLRVVPASVSARAGAVIPITVYALRKDGFNSDIALRLKDAPRGFALNGGWVPGDQDKVRLTLTVPGSGIDKPVNLHLEGHAMIQGKEAVRAGVPAEDMMQAFAYRHLVPSKEWMVRVAPAGRLRSQWKLAADRPVRLPAGGTAPVQLLVPLTRLPGEVRFELSEPPEGIAIQSVAAVKEGLAITLSADAGKIKPGLKGNLIVDAFMERVTNAGDGKSADVRRRQALGTLPAISFEVVAR
jgi:hypothetical protein